MTLSTRHSPTLRRMSHAGRILVTTPDTSLRHKLAERWLFAKDAELMERAVRRGKA